MKLVDANVLLYAVDSLAPHHVAARTWLDASLNGDEETGFAWIVLLAFLRISTKASLYENPLTAAQAFGVVERWLSAKTAVLVEPATTHLVTLRKLVEESGTAGNLTSDAHLAALAIENHATVVTFDADFSRFAGVQIARPMSPP